MDHSPNGNTIEVVFGNASGIKARGTQVENLGDQMIGAAGVLRAIADGGVAQKGLSIDKIKEVIGEIDEELMLAGERYKPSGTALITYANALESVQAEMEAIVPRAQSAWDEYERKRSAHNDAEDAPVPTPTGGESDQSAQDDHDDDVRRAETAMNSAKADFEAEGRLFDDQYETWEAAFDAAADGIRDATDGGIKDGFWDNVDGFVAGVLVVLQWAGVVLAVLALVVGGPIIAALGAIVAVAALALTIYQKARGDAGWLELGLAIVGVIPFGSIAKFSGGWRAGSMAMWEGFTGGLGTAAGRATIGHALNTAPGYFQMSRALGAGRFNAFTNAMHGSAGFDDVAARMMGVAGASEAGDAMSRGGWGAAGLAAGHYGWVVNAPFAAGATVWDAISGQVDGATVDTWADQLAASP